MNLQPEENLLRWYLLGQTSPEEDEQIEQGLREAEAWRDELLLAEEDLTDDYARGALSAANRELFELNFLTTPERRQKLQMAQAAVKYAATQGAKEFASQRHPVEVTGGWRGGDRGEPHRASRHGWALFRPGWKLAVYALLILTSGLAGWLFLPGRDAEVKEGLAEMAQAYRQQRPVEVRISGLDYSRFDRQRGNSTAGASAVDQLARNRAERVLLDAVARRPTAAAHHALGKFYLSDKKFDLAIDELNAALKSDSSNAGIHSDLGAALLEKLKSEDVTNPWRDRPELENRALDHLNRAIVIDAGRLEALFNRALLYQTLNLYQPAREAWEQYLSKDKTSPWAEEARANLEEVRKKSERGALAPDGLYSDFVRAYQRRDEEQAWRAYSRGYLRYDNHITGKLLDDFLAQSSDGQGEAARESLRALSFLGQLSERRTGDRFNSALAAAYRGADARRRKLLAEGRELRRQAYEFIRQTQHDHAAEAGQAALRQFAAAGVVEEELATDYLLAEIHLRRSEHRQSLAGFARVARAWQQRNCHWWYALTCNRLANVHGDLEEFSAAVKYALEAQQIFSRVEDDSGVLRTLITLSSIYHDAGKYRDSIAFARQSLLLADHLALDDIWIITSYNVEANSFRSLDLPAAALEFQRAAVRLAERLRQPQTIARYYVQLGLLYERLRDFDSAVKNIQTGLAAGGDLQQSATGQDIRGYGLLHLGRVLRRAGRNDAALRALDDAAAFYQGKGWEALTYLISKERLLAQIALGNVPSAQQELSRVLQQFEVNRAKILRESLRNSFFDTQQEIYDAAIKFSYLALRRPEEAFAYSELSRSRSLLDAASTERATTDDQVGPDVILPASTPPMALAEIRRRLPPRVQLLQFALLDDRLLIWLVTRKEVVGRQVPVAAAELTTKIKDYLNRLSSPNADDGPGLRHTARELGALLIGPVEDLLDKNQALCVVPDKILNFLPLGALASNRTGKYFIEDYSFVYSPSATLFIRSSENAARKANLAGESLLSVGNPAFERARFPDLPDLPDAASEAEEIAPFYASRVVLTGKDAHKKALLASIENADVVHLAMHYMANDRSPLLSRLLLAQPAERAGGGDLAMYEVYRLPLAKARLVVLSACRTKAEEYYNGEGAIGLSRPFEAAGVPLVISSLWPVDSSYTGRLMIRFHQLRRQQGATTVNALRAAQQELLYGADVRRRHPYYWAGFIVTGGYSPF